MSKSLLVGLFILTGPFCHGQDEAIILVIPSQESKIILDGVEKGQAKAGAAFRIATSVGEHYVEAQTTGGLVKGELIQLEAGKQKIIRIEVDASSNQAAVEAILVADINFNLPGSVTVLAWQSVNEGGIYQYPSHYYGFEKGDEIILDVSMSNKNGTNIIEVTTYPDQVVRYSNKGFTELKDFRIKVPERSIYRFTFATNHAFDRNCFLKIRRKPISGATSSFNPNVALKRIFTPVSIHEPQYFFVNGGLNSTFSNGQSRVIVPISIPQNTVEWYYRFSASRNKADVEDVKNNFKLFSELTTLVFSLTGAGAAVTGLAVDNLAQPPGADYCEIYLLTYESYSDFVAKADDRWRYFPEGTRINFKSGNVKVSSLTGGQYYIGIKNPASMYGINVTIEVVAITAKDEYVLEN